MKQEIEYSVREQTLKNKTVQDAIDAAELIMKINKRYEGTNLNVLQKRKLKPSDQITIVELNKISEQILWDSGYYYSRKAAWWITLNKC